MNPMKTTIFFLSAFLSITAAGCENIKSYLTQAKLYKVVGDAPIYMNDESRTGKTFFITSAANTNDEYAQTAILAAYELHKKNKKLNVIVVELIPDTLFLFTGVDYARAYYATDKKGLYDFSGSDPREPLYFTWLVKSASATMTPKDSTLAYLWYGHIKEFPAKNIYSNLSYEKDDFYKFISDEMHIPVSESRPPDIFLAEYKKLPFIK
jgi:hypothetical protein